MNTLRDSRQSLCFVSFSFSFSELDDVKGIPEFWLTAMKNVDMLAEMIQVCGSFNIAYNLMIVFMQSSGLSCSIFDGIFLGKM